ncbi:MAG: SPOR domain-containing protein [Terracidiphilus sp.]|jgi:cell division septation protein DedD
MRGYFDDEEPKRVDRGRDTEVTLGTGAVIGIALGLLVLCGLCFGLGYAVGHHGGAAPMTGAQTAAPDQEPLQANGTIPKPSASAQAPAPQPTPGSVATTPAAADGGASSGAAQQSGPGGGQPGSPAGTAQPQVKPAIPATGDASQPSPAAATTNVRPAMPGATVALMVQIAAVSHQEDADVLVGALRKRGYSVTAQREPADGLIHVRIGPFTSRDDANRMCKKLLDDGYNAVVQP